jgi:hypothetical protein
VGPQGEQGVQGPQGEPGIGFAPSGYISIPASAFVPAIPSSDFVLITETLQNREASRDLVFWGSVQLPHGVTITNVTAYWQDTNALLEVYTLLYRVRGHDNSDIMTYMTSSGSSGVGSTIDTTIDFAEIDNSQYCYALSVEIPANSPTNSLHFSFVTIGFTYPTS